MEKKEINYMQVNVLGTPYTILYRSKEEDNKFNDDCIGYCDPSLHRIVIMKLSEDTSDLGDLKFENQRVLRHELVHAFAFESGLSGYSSWSFNEEMTDWIANQFPKMMDCFKQIGAV